MTSSRQDSWGRGDRYEPYVGRWSRVVAREFLAWLAIPPHGSWLDVGCGTGALTEIILEESAPRDVMGIDPAPGFVAYARAHVADDRARFEVAEAQDLPLHTASVDAVVSGLVLNFVSNPGQAVAEMRRVARSGGTVAAYVWDYADKMEMMRHFWDAAVDLNPDARELDEGQRFPVCKPQPLRQVFARAGLTEVKMRSIDVVTGFRDFEDYWSPFLGAQGPAPGYAMSLNEEQRNQLRERIRHSLPIASDGSIQLVARAWAVRSVRP